MSESRRTIIFAGDIAMDWNLARTRRSHNQAISWSAEDTTTAAWQRGGASLLAELVGEIAKQPEAKSAGPVNIFQNEGLGDSGKIRPDDPRFHHSFAMWSQFDLRGKQVWRVEEYLGLDRATDVEVQGWQKIKGDPASADLVVMDDADLGFRDRSELWPQVLQTKGNNRPWILLKMAKPLAQGALWETLHRNFADRLIVVATVDDLRLSEVQISRELSWERTAQDVFWELVHNPCVNSFSRAAHTVISFGPSGAILLSPSVGKGAHGFDCTLFFDSKGIEHTWESGFPGGMIGYTTCLAAGLVRQWLIAPRDPDIPAGIQSGLAAMRSLHQEGYLNCSNSSSQARLIFPIERIASKLIDPTEIFSTTKVQDPMRFLNRPGKSPEKPLSTGYWTILQDKFKDELEKVASQVLLEGPEIALKDVPWGQFKNLLTVDRHEIESYRSIRSLVAEYAGQPEITKPLSIAVFGSPGSGKSFGVTQLAQSLFPEVITPITFNLSQYEHPDELASAFHQVRDIGLSGRLPLVFWDEFDSALGGVSLGWLRHFLAPMQDGKFIQDQLSHPIGRAIFVFAGGTSASMAEFDLGDDRQFKAAKGPDFVSRLKGYINVLGPNPVRGPEADPYFILRRAIMLRSSLKREYKELFREQGGRQMLKIDRGVLRAFLKVGFYRHGARSMESVLAMSQLSQKTNFERSCLPSESQLDLHVDGKEFLSLVQQAELEGEILEALAAAAHEIFCEGMKIRGYHFGPEKSESLKTHDALLPYNELPEFMREANRKNVRDIPVKLAAAGYVMIPARSNEPPFNFPGKSLEQLAEDEHVRWMRAMHADGWKHAEKTNEAKKLHASLVPWSKLPDNEREKDRDLVRGIPLILARAGYAILKSNS